MLAGFACIYLDGSHELAEPLVLLADLEGQLSGMAHHKHRDLKQNIETKPSSFEEDSSNMTNN